MFLQSGRGESHNGQVNGCSDSLSPSVCGKHQFLPGLWDSHWSCCWWPRALDSTRALFRSYFSCQSSISLPPMSNFYKIPSVCVSLDHCQWAPQVKFSLSEVICAWRTRNWLATWHPLSLVNKRVVAFCGLLASRAPVSLRLSQHLLTVSVMKCIQCTQAELSLWLFNIPSSNGHASDFETLVFILVILNLNYTLTTTSPVPLLEMRIRMIWVKPWTWGVLETSYGI